MTTTEYPKQHSGMIEQAGAILHLDTALDYGDPLDGNKHWVLDGSCVLVAPDRILTLRHGLDKSRPAAAFFPYCGIVWIKDWIEDYDYGDTLCLCELEKSVTHVAPLRYEYVSRKDLQSVLLVGYGRWTGTEEWKPDWQEDGIQRSVEVKLHLPGSRKSVIHGDNLDINWWSGWNGGLGAGMNNSGGPMLRIDDGSHSILGLTREERRGQQTSSRITKDREEWLKSHLGPPRTDHRGSSGPELRHMNVEVTGSGVYQAFEVPDGAGSVRATLSATPGLRLQMKIYLETDGLPFPGDLGKSDGQSGRFLTRERNDLGDATWIWVGVVPVERAPIRVKKVQAQLCCMFT